VIRASGQLAWWGIPEDVNPVGRDCYEPVGGQFSPMTRSDAPLVDVAQVDSGNRFSCAVTSGQIYCWGQNSAGQLGDGTTTTRLGATLPVQGITDALAVTTGDDHACALHADGTVSCWGAGATSPALVSDLADVRQVSAGVRFTCARLAAGTVSCWGANAFGQLGNGTTADAATPTPVLQISDARHVAAGSRHACAVLATGGVACWGSNQHGQLGDGRPTPTDGAPEDVDCGDAAARAAYPETCGPTPIPVRVRFLP
jgi:alpha-tubulin suppressor-like RCC1 family protein